MSTVTIAGGSDEAGHKRYSDCGPERAEPHLQEALISHRTETRLGAIPFDHLVEKSGIRGFLRRAREQGPIPARCQQEAGGRPSMPLREFPDSFGGIWQAWDTYPQGADSAGQRESAFSKYMANLPTRGGRQPTTVRDQYEAGWLTFKFRNARRRLSPIPADWESADDATLRGYLDSAHESPDQTPPRSSQ